MDTAAHDRTRSALSYLVITIVAAVPWLIAVLPLTLNGMQHVQEAGESGNGSVGLGITMLMLAVLPAMASLLVLVFGITARVQLRRALHFAAAVLFFSGMVSFLSAVLLAMA
ncbi:hypothetical protein P6B95_41535 [Streptomyces atratus]|uniref:hypothetical protein n=1 Tax=Streptomyces atratus TaxID=1893 RepID=UPI00166F9076|nr:hypothetical protein [Streptomyces atratus]WPW33202.1 hypothetical protein P6B95_41535 [Streptomyces atratus]GGT53586.1 hypothetical protein GCM10010207_62030 [Streptomyces atratus]